MNGSGISYEDVVVANVRNQKDKEIENLKQEIERLKEQLNDEIQEELKQSEIMVKKQEEIERLTLSYEDALEDLEKKENIIKEVREYIENTDDFDIEIFDDNTGGCLGTDLSKSAKNILEILDKGE